MSIIARYDKFDSKISGPRGFLAQDWLPADLDKVVGIGMNARGQFVKGAGQTGIIAVLVLTQAVKAGERPVDPMKHGEIVNFDRLAGQAMRNPLPKPGTKYYADPTTGEVSDTETGGVYVGHTIEAQRLIVNVKEA